MSAEAQEATVAILREALDTAAARVIAKRDDPEGAHRGCPTCGRRLRGLTPGHIYALLAVFAFLSITIIGSVTK